MNTPNFSPDDPKLTAYALGELDAAETAEIEARLCDDPEARAAVEAIRAMTAQIETALAGEPLPLVTAAANPGKARKGILLRFPQFFYAAATLAAACLTVLVVLHSPNVADHSKLTENLAVGQTEGATAKEKTDLATAEPNAVATEVLSSNLRDNVVNLPAEMPAVVAPPPTIFAGQRQISAAEAVVEHRVDTFAATKRAPLSALAAPKEAASPPVTTGGKREEETVTLAPFEVQAGKDMGYLKGNAEAATRIGMEVQSAEVSAAARMAVQKAESDEGSKKAALRVVGGWDSNSLASRQMTLGFTAERTLSTEAYAYQQENRFLETVQNPLSTFSIDVDTASYANVRRFLNQGRRPPVDAVRIEELINYFPYHYVAPQAENRDEGGAVPFAASMEVAEAPWAPEHRLVRIGLKGREVSVAARPAANLVFLLDVSGSMNRPNKLPLVKESLRLLMAKLRADDRVAIVTYAGRSGLALASTPVRRSAEILSALEDLQPGGLTNGAMGIQLAYDIAKANFAFGGINRVILCTDGDFNVGTTSQGELTRLVEEKVKSDVFLTVFGFGMGNYKDEILEQLADKGNGNYGYIDTRREAQKLLVEQVSGTLVTIAKDVKIQVEFNPAVVQAYRLIGYENRMLQKEDFNNDKVDAGEIGAGHTVTALYEVVPAGEAMPETGTVDALKYQRPAATVPANQAEMLTLKIRYKQPAAEVSSKLEFPLTDRGESFAEASADFKFAAAVAGFGMILRDSPHKAEMTFVDVTAWAQAGLQDDPGGYRSEFLGLVEQAGRVVQ